MGQPRKRGLQPPGYAFRSPTEVTSRGQDTRGCPKTRRHPERSRKRRSKDPRICRSSCFLHLRYPKASALGLMGQPGSGGFSPWGMPSVPQHRSLHGGKILAAAPKHAVILSEGRRIPVEESRRKTAKAPVATRAAGAELLRGRDGSAPWLSP